MESLRIHFVANEAIAEQLWGPVQLLASARGHNVSMSSDPNQHADIGFYCRDKSFPGPQKLTVIMRNGMDQDHDVLSEPWLFFERENWGHFDLGLVPGPYFSRQAQMAASRTSAIPKLGVVQTGWPKSDDAVTLLGGQVIRPLPSAETVLYAPQIECDGKQRELVDLMRGSGRFLLIKHWESKDEADAYPGLLTEDYMENLERENFYASQFDWVEILPPQSNFFEHVSRAHVLVSDQSSVLLEALLVGVPTISVKDWRHNCGETCGGVAGAIILSSRATLGRDLDHIFSGIEKYTNEAITMREDLYSDLGRSAAATLDSVIAAFKFQEKAVPLLQLTEKERTEEMKKAVFWLDEENKRLRTENTYFRFSSKLVAALRRPGRKEAVWRAIFRGVRNVMSLTFTLRSARVKNPEETRRSNN